MEEAKIVTTYHYRTLEEFKEVGEPGRGQVIVTHAGLTLEGAGNWDPLLTQLYQIGVGWAQAIVNMSGLQFHVCILLLAAKTGSKEGGADEKCGGVASCPWDPIHLPKLSMKGLSHVSPSARWPLASGRKLTHPQPQIKPRAFPEAAETPLPAL